MTTMAHSISATLSNPFLEDVRNWTVNRRRGHANVMGTRLNLITGQSQARTVAVLSPSDAHFICVGLEILARLTSQDRTPEVMEMAQDIFEQSSAVNGWTVRNDGYGILNLVSSQGKLITRKPLNVSQDEVDFLNSLPTMARWALRL